MKVLFLDKNNAPVSYTLDPSKETWQQSAGNKKIPIRSVIFWDRVAFIGGVESVPEKCEIQIQPTSGNMNTIGVRYVVKKDGAEFVGFGSANDYSTIKTEKEIKDWQGNIIKDSSGRPKVNVSGSVRYAVEMAVKRAKNNAVASALRLTNDAAPDYEESFDFIINPELRNQIKHNYKAPDMTVSPLADGDEDEPDYGSNETKSSGARTPANTASTSASKPAEKTVPREKPSAAASSDPDSFKINFGKHKGKTMLQVLSDDASYIEWLAKESNKDDIRANAIALLEKYQDLAKVRQGKGGNTSNGAAAAEVKPHSHSAESEHHTKLRSFWTERKYSNVAAKEAIADFLKKPDITWGQVTKEEAERMYKEREHMFPPQVPTDTPESPFEEEAPPANKGSDEAIARKCAACGNDLVTMEITFSEKYKEKYQGHYFCFEHQSDENAINKVLNK